MYYFIHTYSATIDGTISEIGTIGISSDFNDHQPNKVKSIVENYYRNKYPGSKQVAVVLISVKQTDEAGYNIAQKSFIDIDNY
jgi:hypothetical protein